MLCAISPLSAQAADFTISNGQTATTTQTLGAGANETGTVEEGGTIATTANTLTAIISTSAGSTITNNGTISTTGDSAHGTYVNVPGASSTFTNTGTLTTSGAGSHGFYALAGTGHSVTNSGGMATTGDGSMGVFLFADNSNVTNSGTISTSGDNAAAMFAFIGGSNTLTNNGLLMTTGDNSSALFSNAGSNNSLINNGTIITNGTESRGMLAHGSSNTLTNNGRVISNGTTAAMRVSNASGTIINQGYVTSVGGNAVEMSATDSTLIVKPGSIIDGTVLFDGGGNRILQYDVSGTGSAGGVLAINGTVTGSPTTTITNTSSLPSGTRVVQGGNVVAVVTPEQFGASQQLISNTVNDAGAVLNNRQQLALLGDTSGVNSGTQYATSTNTLSDAQNPNEWALRDRKVAWVEGFGSYQQRGAGGQTAESRSVSGGALAGVDLPQTDEGMRAGFYAGGFSGQLNVGTPTFRKLDSTGGMAGGYVGKSYGNYYVSGQFGAGFSQNDSDRYTGADTASADYSSYFLSPALTVMHPVQGDGITWVPNATLRYTAQFDGSYTETGSVTNQTVGSRNSHVIDGRLMLDGRFDAIESGQNGMLFPAFRIGLAAQTLLGNNSVSITTLGNNLSFDPDGNDYVGGIVGVTLTHTMGESAALYFDGEADLGLNKGGPGSNKGIAARIGAKWAW